MFYFLSFGFLLLVLNVVLILFIKESRSFAILPGWIYTALFFCFAGYLFWLLSLYTPLGPAPNGYGLSSRFKPDDKIAANNAADRKYLIRYTVEEKKYLKAKGERDDQIKEDMDTVNNFLNFLALQSGYAFIAAIVGARIIKIKANYYYAFAGLHVFLILLVLAVKVIINREAS